MIWVMVIVIYMVGITFGTFGTFSSFALAFIALGALATFALTFAALGALSSFSLACTIFDIMIIVNYNSNLAVVWGAQSTCSMMVMVVIVGNVHIASAALGALATFALTFATLGALSSFSLACTMFDIMIIVNYDSNLAVVWRTQSTCSMMVMVVIVGNVHITSFAALGALTTFALTFAALGALATFALALVTLATFALSSWINVNITE
jgi:hypothetical protein